ncbi:MAG: hypothetical protein E4H36_14095 [Spirochaetales bacterium]|nr:MAG: hypothetical protein E4H36_14095 [Spirochaetales bacterium]
MADKGSFSYHAECRIEDSSADDKTAFLLAVAKEIGGAFVYASCDIEAIILTGPMLREKAVRLNLRSRVGRLAPVTILDKNMELAALSSQVLDALKDKSQVLLFNVKEK